MKTADILAWMRGRADEDIRRSGYALTDEFEKLSTAFEDRQEALIREQEKHEHTMCRLYAAEECLREVRTTLATRYDDKDVCQRIDRWADGSINGHDDAKWNVIHKELAYVVGPRRHASLWRRTHDEPMYTIEFSENVKSVDELFIDGATELRDDLTDLIAFVPNGKDDRT